MIKSIKCERCAEGSTLAMERAGQTIICWCSCIADDPKAKNSLLEGLRKDGFDIGPELFSKAPKEAAVGKYAGKFATKAKLQQGFDNLIAVAGVPEREAARIVEMIGLEKGYIRIETNWKKRTNRVKG